MSDGFDPYKDWLDIHDKVENHYQLLRISQSESDPIKIRRAADRAITRVRSYLPGERTAEWMQLLDQLKRIRSELTDPALKKAYDESLLANDISLLANDISARRLIGTVAAERDPPTPSETCVAIPVQDEITSTLAVSLVENSALQTDVPNCDRISALLENNVNCPPVDTVSSSQPISAYSDPEDAVVSQCITVTTVDQRETSLPSSTDVVLHNEWEKRIPAVKLRHKRSKTKIVLVLAACTIVPVAVAGVPLKAQLHSFIKSQWNLFSGDHPDPTQTSTSLYGGQVPALDLSAIQVENTQNDNVLGVMSSEPRQD